MAARRPATRSVRSIAPVQQQQQPPPRPTPRELHADHEIIVWTEARGREPFFARIFDRRTYRHYGGSGVTAWEAIAWALDSFVRRGLLGQPHSMTRDPRARPGDGLIGATS